MQTAEWYRLEKVLWFFDPPKFLRFIFEPCFIELEFILEKADWYRREEMKNGYQHSTPLSNLHQNPFYILWKIVEQNREKTESEQKQWNKNKKRSGTKFVPWLVTQKCTIIYKSRTKHYFSVATHACTVYSHPHIARWYCATTYDVAMIVSVIVFIRLLMRNCIHCQCTAKRRAEKKSENENKLIIASTCMREKWQAEQKRANDASYSLNRDSLTWAFVTPY